MAAYSGVHRLPVAAFVCFAGGLCFAQTSQYVATTIAGGGLPSTPATAVGTPVAYPHSVVADSSGNLYFTAMNCVFQVDSGGTATRVAGNSASPGYSGDGGPATSAQFSNPEGPAIDGAGNLYVADSGNGTIRRIGPNGVITSLILNGSSAYFGVRSPLLSPFLNYPIAVAVDGSGNLYIGESAAVLRVAANGALTTIAGTGTTGDSGDGGPATSAQLNSPAGIAVDASGNVYFADNMSNRVRKIGTNGTINTVAGTGVAGYSGDGGPAAPFSQLNSPNGISLDAAGALYIADTNNYVIRKVAPGGMIASVAGNGQLGYGGDGGPASAGQLSFPYGVATDTAGNLYITDTWNSRIRKVSAGGTLSTYAGNGTAWWGRRRSGHQRFAVRSVGRRPGWGRQRLYWGLLE
jgi:sugar lactone lactonase YvrE